MGDVLEKNVTITIPFSSAQYASLAHSVLCVDKEIKGSGVQKVITVDGTDLKIHFFSEDLKKVRVVTNSYLKNVLLILKTINKFNIE